MPNSANDIPSFLLKPQPAPGPGVRVKSSFIDKGMGHISRFYEAIFEKLESSRKDGLFQRLNARIKVAFLVFYVFAVSVKTDISSEAVAAVFIFPFVVMSKVGIFRFYGKALMAGFLFGMAAGLPALFNVITPGEPVYRIMELQRQYDLWIYHVPSSIAVTREGMLTVMMLTARIFNSVTITLLVVSTTSFSDLLKSLKVFGVPQYLTMILGLSHKYTFIFMKMIRDMHMAKKARLISKSDAVHWVTGRMAFIFDITQRRCEEVYRAMAGRGFTGEVRLTELRLLNSVDIIYGAMLLSLWMVLLIV